MPFGLGSIAGPGGATGCLKGSFNINVSGDFFDQATGAPRTLKARYVRRVKVTARAPLVQFSNAGDSHGMGGNVVFTATDGSTFTIQNAKFTSDVGEFNEDGVAVRNCTWIGDGLERG